MTRLQQHYNEIVADVTGNLKQIAWGREGLSCVESRVKKFKKKLADAFKEFCDFGVYTLKYNPLPHKTEDTRCFGWYLF